MLKNNQVVLLVEPETHLSLSLSAESSPCRTNFPNKALLRWQPSAAIHDYAKALSHATLLVKQHSFRSKQWYFLTLIRLNPNPVVLQHLSECFWKKVWKSKRPLQYWRTTLGKKYVCFVFDSFCFGHEVTQHGRKLCFWPDVSKSEFPSNSRTFGIQSTPAKGKLGYPCTTTSSVFAGASFVFCISKPPFKGLMDIEGPSSTCATGASTTGANGGAGTGAGGGTGASTTGAAGAFTSIAGALVVISLTLGILGASSASSVAGNTAGCSNPSVSATPAPMASSKLPKRRTSWRYVTTVAVLDTGHSSTQTWRWRSRPVSAKGKKTNFSIPHGILVGGSNPFEKYQSKWNISQ